MLIFIDTDCPIANAYVPEINRVYREFAERDVKLTLVHVNPNLSDEAAAEHAADYSLTPPHVIDRQHELVRFTKATVTPEAFVFDSSGDVAYHGRIDNLYSDYGDRRQVATQAYLRDALEAVLAGTPVEVEFTTPLGCFIETLEQ